MERDEGASLGLEEYQVGFVKLALAETQCYLPKLKMDLVNYIRFLALLMRLESYTALCIKNLLFC